MESKPSVPVSTLSAGRAGALAFLVAAATLFLQVLEHRIVSAKLLSNYAFVVVSLTMLGFAAAGVVLSLVRDRAIASLSRTATVCAAGFTLSSIGAVALFNRAETAAPFSLPGSEFVGAFFDWLPLALVLAVPFAFAGLLLGTLLTKPELATRRIYFLDLVGSAVGAFAVLPAISWIGVESALLLVGALLLDGTLALAPPGWRLGIGAMLPAAAALVFAFGFRDKVFAIRYPAGDKRGPPGGPTTFEHVAWDPIARIEVSRMPPLEPNEYTLPLLGTNARFLSRFERMITQNNYAYTCALRYDGTPDSLVGIEETMYAAAYPPLSVPRPRTLVIGVGGGFDVLTALHFDASEVTGIEVNAATLGILTRTYRDYFLPWVGDPRVRLVHQEGRNYLATEERRYDVIQLSGVDSYSGSPGAAHVFSENYLYTVEAFDLYLRRLSDYGIIHMLRLEHRPPREMLRALVTAVAALRRAGVKQPEEHVVTLTADRGNLMSLLVKRNPFLPEELERLSAWARDRRGFSISAAPGRNDKRENAYQAFLTLREPRLERVFAGVYPFDIEPTEDDRPFFFRGSRWSHLVSSDPVHRIHPPVMELSLLVLFSVTAAATLASVLLPLAALSLPRERRPQLWRYGLFFAATGLGYLAIEIAFLQKFGLFLGHPNYALSAVLASLLFFSGVGSLVSARLVRRLGGVRFVAYVLAGVVLVEYLVLLPWLPELGALALAWRVLIVGLLVAAPGVLMGSFFPTALESLKTEAPAFVPWAWGINGVFSVLAPILAVGFSMTFGISALLLASLPIYLVAGWVLPRALGAVGEASEVP